MKLIKLFFSINCSFSVTSAKPLTKPLKTISISFERDNDTQCVVSERVFLYITRSWMQSEKYSPCLPRALDAQWKFTGSDRIGADSDMESLLPSCTHTYTERQTYWHTELFPQSLLLSFMKKKVNFEYAHVAILDEALQKVTWIKCTLCTVHCTGHSRTFYCFEIISRSAIIVAAKSWNESTDTIFLHYCPFHLSKKCESWDSTCTSQSSRWKCQTYGRV